LKVCTDERFSLHLILETFSEALRNHQHLILIYDTYSTINILTKKRMMDCLQKLAFCKQIAP